MKTTTEEQLKKLEELKERSLKFIEEWNEFIDLMNEYQEITGNNNYKN